MAEKITDYTTVTVLPSDTLFDVSIDVDSAPLTRSIRLSDMQNSLGVFYNIDGSINDPLRKVDLNTNTVQFDKGRFGVNGLPVAGSETFLIRRHSSDSSILRVVGGVSGTDEYFSVGDGGFISINNASQFSSESLGVNGDTLIKSTLSGVASTPLTVRRSNNSLLCQVTTGGSGDGIFSIYNSAGSLRTRFHSNSPSYINNTHGLVLGSNSNTNGSLLEVHGDVELIGGSGNNLIIQSPDNTRYKIEVDNLGVLSATAV